jgi:hypothetical protein
MTCLTIPSVHGYVLTCATFIFSYESRKKIWRWAKKETTWLVSIQIGRLRSTLSALHAPRHENQKEATDTTTVDRKKNTDEKW